MARRLTGKERAARIPLDYYKGRDRIAAWKLRLSGLALLVALGWWGSGFVPAGLRGAWAESDFGRLRYSHGPVARVHAAWDAKCDACHAPFRPIARDAWTNALGASASSADSRCQACHQVADHHASQVASEVQSCAGCHRDHRGRDASLVRLPDADCLSCHEDLKDHVKAGAKPEGYADASGFPGGHDEFRLLRDGPKKARDPGGVKFNHALHMTPGFNEVAGGKPVLALGQLAEADRGRYARPGQAGGDGVRLDCASCHRSGDGDRPPSSGGGDGAFMKPVSYATDCAACHKLEVPLGAGDSLVAVPHGVQPAAIEVMLRNAAIGSAMATQGTAPAKRERPLPGRGERPTLPDREEVQRRVLTAEKLLFGAGKGVCTECHAYVPFPAAALGGSNGAGVIGTSGSGGAKPRRAWLPPQPVVPANIPSAWFTHARFDHPAHRGVSCRECHAGAYAGKDGSRTSADVLIPGKATCAACHAPESRSADGLATGGAGHSCTECHRYHGGDHGRPAPAVDEGMALRAFLMGGSGTSK